MSNPTSSTHRGKISPAVSPKRAGKRKQYKAPTILTYTDDQFLRELGPAKASGTHSKHA